MRPRQYYIGLDDTDFGDSIGTGALSRELMVHLEREVGAVPRGITRHQFLVHPDIPYTSHNSSACLEIETPASEDDLVRVCGRFVEFLFHPGADPGLCIARREQLTGEMIAFGRRAQAEVVAMDEALATAGQAGVFLRACGGDGLGVIGALGGCALRMDGNDGRFILLRGIREADPEMTVREIRERTAIELVLDEAGNPAPPDAVVSTNNWIRPDLVAGKVVLAVQGDDRGGYFIRKRKKGTDDM